MNMQPWATSPILMRMMKMGGGKQLALSRYFSRACSGSIHLEMDSWNLSQQPTSPPLSGRSSPALNGLPSRSTGKGSCCSRSKSSIAAPNLRQKTYKENNYGMHMIQILHHHRNKCNTFGIQCYNTQAKINNNYYNNNWLVNKMNLCLPKLHKW